MTIWHYTECGLDHVVIETSVSRDDAGDDVIAIPAIGLLHRAIAEGVINTMGVLTGREFRFLRTEMGLTQGELARFFHCDSQSIARWEKGQTLIDPVHDMVMRTLVAERLGLTLKRSSIEDLSRDRIATTEMTPIKITHSHDQKNGHRYTVAA